MVVEAVAGIVAGMVAGMAVAHAVANHELTIRNTDLASLRVVV